MSVAGDGIEEGGQGEGGLPAEPAEIEGDVPKPAFEEPAEPERSDPEQAARPLNGKERRAQKAGGYAAEMARWRNEALKERDERVKLNEKLARLEGEFRARGNTAEPVDPVREQLRQTRQGIEQALERMGNGDKAALEEWHALREREQRIISRAEAEAVAQRNAPPRQDPVLSAVVARHDWLQTDPELRQVAEGRVAALVRKERRDMTDPAVRKQTLLQAAAEVERDFEIGGGGNEPTEVQRERFRGTGGQSSGAGRTDSKSMVYLTSDQKAQAEALFRNLDPDAAHKKWWLDVGKRIVDKK